VERRFGSEDSTQNQAKEAYLGSNDLLGQEGVPVCGLGYPSHADCYMYAGDAVAQVAYCTPATTPKLTTPESTLQYHNTLSLSTNPATPPH